MNKQVILNPIREVPHEVMFKISDAIRDQTKKNRYWFDFPSQWSNQLDKDPIIGIRSIYQTKTNRLVNLKLSIQIVSDSIGVVASRTGNIMFWLDGNTNITEFTMKFDKYWFDATNEEYIKDGITFMDKDGITPKDFKWNSNILSAHFDYDPDKHKCVLCIGLSYDVDKQIIVEDANTEMTYICKYRIVMQAINLDTVAILGTGNEIISENSNDIEIPIWSRYQCYVLSSLAEDDANGFIGHTRNVQYYPIKYYRLKNKVKRFWIELYETRYHDVPVTLPYDNRDDIFIEAIVCFSSNGML